MVMYTTFFDYLSCEKNSVSIITVSDNKFTSGQDSITDITLLLMRTRPLTRMQKRGERLKNYVNSH